MKKKPPYILISLTIIFFICNVFLLAKTHSLTRSLEGKESSLKSKNESIQKWLKSNNQIRLENEMCELKNVKVYEGNDKGRVYNFLDSVQTTTLVARISGAYCDACINMVMEKLSEHFEDFSSNDNIVVLTSEFNPRLKSNFFNKQMLSYEDEELGIPFEKTKMPFLFVLDEKKIPMLLYVPSVENPSDLDEYLMIIKSRFFKDVTYEPVSN